MAKIVLDLHGVFNKGITIDAELNRVIAEAIEKKIALVEIIPGKGSGQLKKRVLRFLAQSEIKSQYHRLESDDKNFGIRPVDSGRQLSAFHSCLNRKIGHKKSPGISPGFSALLALVYTSAIF